MLVCAAVASVPSSSLTAKLANVKPLVVFTVVVGSSWLFPEVANSFHLSLSEASLNKPENFLPESVYSAKIPRSTLSALLSFPRWNSGSSITVVELLIVVVEPCTSMLPLNTTVPATVRVEPSEDIYSPPLS